MVFISHIEYDNEDYGKSYTLFGERITYNNNYKHLNIMGDCNAFDYVPIDENTVSLIKIKIIAKDCVDMSVVSIFKIRGMVKNGSVLEFLETPSINRLFGNEELMVSLELDNEYNGMYINVKGNCDKIKWFGKIEIIQL